MALLIADGFNTTAPITKGVIHSTATQITGRLGGNAIRVSGTWNATEAITYAHGSTQDTITVGFAYRTNSLAGMPGAGAIVRFALSGNPDERDSISIVHNTSGGIVFYGGYTYDNLFATSAPGVLAINTWHYIEVEYKSHPSAGTFKTWVDGALVMNYSGDTTYQYGSNPTVLPYVHLRNQTNSSNNDFDDFYCLDGTGATNNTRLGDLVIETIYPSGNGNSSQWVGSDSNSTDNYLLIDETSVSTADYVGSSTSGHKDTYVFTDLSRTVGTVHAAVINTHAAKSDTGAASYRHVARSSATEVDSADIAPTIGYDNYSTVQATDPNGGGAWTISSINAAEFGVKRV
jgi:hypothetical protein